MNLQIIFNAYNLKKMFQKMFGFVLNDHPRAITPAGDTGF